MLYMRSGRGGEIKIDFYQGSYLVGNWEKGFRGGGKTRGSFLGDGFFGLEGRGRARVRATGGLGARFLRTREEKETRANTALT